MKIIHLEKETITRKTFIIYHDSKKHKRVETVTQKTGSEPTTDIDWYFTVKDLLEPVEPKEWKILGFNEGNKLEKEFLSDLENRKNQSIDKE